LGEVRDMGANEEKLAARRKRAAKMLRSADTTPKQRSWAARVLAGGGSAVEAGKRGGAARAQSLSPERRKEIAHMGGKAAAAKMKKRWKIIKAVEAAEAKARKDVIDKLLEVQDKG